MIVKRLLFICCMCISFGATGQLVDDFADGDFTNNPVWSGDDAFFIIQNDTLRSAGPSATSILYLSTQNTAINKTTWEFLIKLNFNPTSSNQVKVYLVSDQSDLEADLNGYFIEIGQSSDDIIKFRRQTGATSTTLFSGSTLFSGNILVRIKVNRDELGNWEVLSDPTGASNFASEGVSFQDNTFTTSNYFGIVCKHTTTRKDLFFFDNFSISVELDTDSPMINSIQVVSNTEIDLQFSEAVDQTTAETITNYNVNNGIGQALSATLDGVDNSLVHLTFGSSFENNINYEITVQNVEDLIGNTIVSEVESFDVLITETAIIGDIVINELMADPTPQVGLPNSEYVEIYNRSTKYISLADYTLSEKEITSGTQIIAPNEYVILCEEDNIALFQSFGTVIGLSSWNTLTNGGEKVTLNDVNNGLIIDELAYDLSWYNDQDKDDGGWSLERVNPDHQCSGDTNWTASEDDEGGTPGAINSVFDDTPDLIGPMLLSVAVISSDSLRLRFDEQLDSVTFESAVFVFDPIVAVDTVFLEDDLKTVIVVFTELLQTSINYTVTVTALKDCSGNVIGNDQSASFLLTSPAESNDIIISEIMADPTPEVGLPEAEYIEIYNRTDKYIDLINCAINSEVITSVNKTIAPSQYIILCDNGDEDLFEDYGEVIGVVSWNSLTNAGKTIALTNASSQLIDEVSYNDSWYNSIDKSDGGWSLELIDTENICGEESNWSASIDDNGGTPGGTNSINGNKPDLTGPALLSAIAITPDSLILQFDERLDAASFPLVEFSFEPSLTIDHTVLGSDFRQVTVVISSLLQVSTVHEITVNLLRDCNGNLIGDNNTQVFALSEVAEQGDLLINELLYNPMTSGGDFLEVYNHSTKYINLKGWMIANGSDDVPENQKIISDDHLLISPQQYLVFSQNPSVVAADYPRGIVENFVEVSSLPSFPNDRQGVVLLNSASIVFDYFPYDDEMQHSLLDDDKGVSLERISFDSPASDRSNWHSAAKSEGFATPGYVNSQALNSPKNTANDILISPQVFLPNQSGQNDFTTINYLFDQPGFVATVSILDITGRVISSITQNELLATEGFFQWDGTLDNGRKARSGPYIVLFEVFDLSGNQKKYKKRVVIAPEL